MLVNILPMILNFLKSKYTYIGLVIIVFGIMFFMIDSLQKTVDDKQDIINTLNTNIVNLQSKIDVLENNVKDKDKSLSEVNNVLNECRNTQAKQLKDIFEINSIMNEAEQETTKNPTEQIVKEKTNEVSKTTYVKGINFINNSLSSVK